MLKNDTFEPHPCFRIWWSEHNAHNMLPFCWYNCFVIKKKKNGVEFRYEKYHAHHGGDEEERKANYTDMVRKLSLFDAGRASSFLFI